MNQNEFDQALHNAFERFHFDSPMEEPIPREDDYYEYVMECIPSCDHSFWFQTLCQQKTDAPPTDRDCEVCKSYNTNARNL